MLAKVHSCAVFGLEAYIVSVEVDFNPRAGVPAFTIVGLPDAAVRESRERVRAAIKNSNRATSRRKRGESSQGLDGLKSTLGDQSQHTHEEHHFGLQFPKCGQPACFTFMFSGFKSAAEESPMAIRQTPAQSIGLE
jgi:hypothetical protein